MVLNEVIYWNSESTNILLLNFLIVIGLFTSLRIFSGTLDHVNADDELLKKDNFAFGISLVGVVFAVSLILTGALYGEPIYSVKDTVVAVFLYGILGIVLMAITRVIFNKVALQDISVSKEIKKGNYAAAIVDAGNVIAAAIVIKAVMMWITSNTLEGVKSLLIGYVVSQVILTCSTLLRIKIFHRKNDKTNLQKELLEGNTALALRFAGRKIGSAFAIAAASNIIIYGIHEIEILLAVWFLISVIMILVLNVISYIADKIILYKVDTEDEVVRQRNAAIGALQAIIFLCLGLLLSELLI